MVSVKDAKAIISLLKSAEHNLDLSKHAYNKKYYAEAIFNLHLSVEKVLKAYGLYSGFVSLEELKKDIGHVTPKVMGKILSADIIKESLDFMRDAGILRVDDRYVDEKSDDFLKNKEKVIELPHQEIVNFLDNVDKYCASMLNSNKGIESFISPILALAKLTEVAYVLFPHYFTSNYPNGKWNPIDTYTDSIGIVRAYPKMISFIESAEQKVISDIMGEINGKE